jgi:chromosome segregation ATPase
MVINMTSENYRRLEDKIDGIVDKLNIIQQNMVELRTDKVNQCKDIDNNKAEIEKTNKKVDTLEDLLANLNVKVILLGAGGSLLMTAILLLAAWLLGKL